MESKITDLQSIVKSLTDGKQLPTSSPSSSTSPVSFNNSIPDQPEPKPNTTLIIGSSILQQIIPSALFNVCVKTLRGAVLPVIFRHLSKLHIPDNKSIIIQAGGNDVNQKRKMADIEKDISNTIDYIKGASPKTKIFLSEVLPRGDTDVSEINKMYRTLAQKSNISLITVHSNFYKKANLLWKDRIHLTDEGTQKLLETYDKFVSIFKDAFLADLSRQPFSCIEHIDDPNIAIETWYSLFNHALDFHAPRRRRRVKRHSQPQWFNDEIQEARRLRDYFKKKNKNYFYKYWRNETKSLITKSKVNFIKNSVKEKDDLKNIWQFFNEAKGKINTNHYPENILHRDTEYTDLNDIADVMNNYFTNITDDIKPNYKPLSCENITCIENHVSNKVPQNQYFKIDYIKCNNVLNLLLSLDCKKSTGPDFIGPKILP
ncbi:hypothetical protein LOTGIDRAFT_166523 [Lottia gigantea]|uniref:SGNH hydrolase-type esterase domain-containing protein n=1 Tax=Lottia gigantea TaxID=225164 RepID=V3ZXQ5_LOTGI|nr:hypothetical protein LOTGIDRAFT_166523 [Lottia gigantea]ESO87375.1 hypothetical protein LOTGIDRAFT_166523 [Lottia gigantea]